MMTREEYIDKLGVQFKEALRAGFDLLKEDPLTREERILHALYSDSFSHNVVGFLTRAMEILVTTRLIEEERKT